jgi:hypothetical protein
MTHIAKTRETILTEAKLRGIGDAEMVDPHNSVDADRDVSEIPADRKPATTAALARQFAALLEPTRTLDGVTEVLVQAIQGAFESAPFAEPGDSEVIAAAIRSLMGAVLDIQETSRISDTIRAHRYTAADLKSLIELEKDPLTQRSRTASLEILGEYMSWMQQRAQDILIDEKPVPTFVPSPRTPARETAERWLTKGYSEQAYFAGLAGQDPELIAAYPSYREIVDHMATQYMARFSAEELKTMLDRAESPLGLKSLEVEGEITAKLGEYSQARLGRFKAAVGTRLEGVDSAEAFLAAIHAAAEEIAPNALRPQGAQRFGG